ncbi:MAG: signal peptidase I [Oscillospiraceae bacterium]|jgi:signal peptidase I|nr:signal peptidase I [Oscillospiraceae bacterium]
MNIQAQSEQTDQLLEQSASSAKSSEARAKSKKSGDDKKSAGREILEWVISILVAVAIALIIRTFIFEPIRVDGESMLKTLSNNEYMIVTKPEYMFGEPSRFDVVICHYPNRKENFVKRIVGLPGDTVEMRDGYLYVNGDLYEEDYLAAELRPTYEGKWTLSDGEYFVLGDNRKNSNDSHLIGPITKDMIVGHVRLVVWPLSEMRVVQ